MAVRSGDLKGQKRAAFNEVGTVATNVAAVTATD